MNSLLIGLASPLAIGHAYLDPGSGSFLLQLLIATAVGGLFLVKTYWGKIKTFVGRLFSRSNSVEKDE